MGLLNTLITKIFGHAETPAAKPADTGGASGGATATASQSSAPASATAAATAAPAAPAQSVDINATLNALAAKNSEKLDWKRSIVDLMKLVGMDSSLSARKQLATELHYSGDQSDSASMNIWLHKEVLKKLAENGGKVPAELLD